MSINDETNWRPKETLVVLDRRTQGHNWGHVQPEEMTDRPTLARDD